MSGRYNGWTNHETWLANLWLTNVEHSYRILCEAMMLPDSVLRAEWLEDQVWWSLNEHTGEACLWSDLFNLSMGPCELV